MTQRIVLFALRNWLGPPRLPRTLQRAGFEVAVVCPFGKLLAQTQYVDQRIELQSGTPFRDIFHQLWRLVVDWGATSVIAVDDLAVLRFQEFALAVLDDKVKVAQGKDVFMRMLQQSLPPPGQFDHLNQKAKAHALATAAGIPVPAQVECPTVNEALAFAAAHGYPAVLKTDRGSGGTGVAICADENSLRESYARLYATLNPGSTSQLLAEQFVGGPQISYPFVALRGRLLTGLTRLKVKAHPEPLGPSSVVELVDIPAAAQAAARFAARCQYTGFASIQFLLDPVSKAPQFLEFNPRPVPMMHMDEELVGINWCKAWYAAMDGKPTPIFRGPVIGRRIALFPQEWLRDPQSDYLQTGAVQDVLQEDALLLQAYQQLR